LSLNFKLNLKKKRKSFNFENEMILKLNLYLRKDFLFLNFKRKKKRKSFNFENDFKIKFVFEKRFFISKL
jgi:hypothetical protein